MTSPKSGTDLGLSAPYPYPSLNNNYNSDFDRLDVLTTSEDGSCAELDLAVVPRSSYTKLTQLDRFIDRYLETNAKDPDEPLPSHLPVHLGKLIDGIGPRISRAVHVWASQGAATVASVLGDLPSGLSDEQCQKTLAELVSHAWLGERNSIHGLLFGWQPEVSEEHYFIIDGVMLGLLALQEVQRCVGEAQQNERAAEAQRRRASENTLKA